MSVILSANNYGKSRVRLVHVLKRGERHDLKDINVDIAFEGEFETAHTVGDNSAILPTDTMKNTVYALARQQAPGEIEQFGRRLAAHFLDNNPQVSKVTIDLAEQAWERISIGERRHPHAFVKGSQETRTARVTSTRDRSSVMAGVESLVLLKTTCSAFFGYIKDPFTTLPETLERIFATALQASWTYIGEEDDYAVAWKGVRTVMLETFAAHDSLSVQHTLYAMGEAVLQAFDYISEIRLSMPNKHHLLVDLSRFGMDNKNEVFVPTDEPHGLIEATLKRG